MVERFESGVKKGNVCDENSPKWDWRQCFDDGLKHPRPGQKGDPYLGMEPWMYGEHESDNHPTRTLHRPKTFDPPAGAHGETRTVKPGDNLWVIAQDVLKSTNGRTPSNKDIADTVGRMTVAMGEKDPNAILLRPGDKVFVPLPESRADATKQLPAVEICEADRDSEKVQAHVQKNEQGEVASVTYPNGSSREFEYTSPGQPDRIVFRSAPDKIVDVWEKGAGGKWRRLIPDAQGQLQVTKDTWIGKVTVDQSNGNLIYEADVEFDDPKHEIDPVKVTVRPDGTEILNFGEYSALKNEKGQVVEATDPKGKKIKFEYRGDQLSQIYSGDGKPVLDGSETSVNVEENGDYEIGRADGSKVFQSIWGYSMIEAPDGSREYHQRDGSITRSVKAADGTEVYTCHISAKGREFEITDGKALHDTATYVIKPDDTLEAIAEDALRQSVLYGSQPGEISQESIELAAQYLARANGIVSPDLLPTGYRLSIPENMWVNGQATE